MRGRNVPYTQLRACKNAHKGFCLTWQACPGCCLPHVAKCRSGTDKKKKPCTSKHACKNYSQTSQWFYVLRLIFGEELQVHAAVELHKIDRFMSRQRFLREPASRMVDSAGMPGALSSSFPLAILLLAISFASGKSGCGGILSLGDWGPIGPFC